MKTNLASKILVTVGLLGLGAPLSAQQSATPNNTTTANTNGLVASVAADAAWSDLSAAVQSDASNSADNNSSDPTVIKASKAKQAAKHVDNAKLAKDFYTKYPDHPKVSDARELEVMSLVGAVGVGDTASEAALDATIEVLRADPKVAKNQRARVAGIYEFTRAARKNKNPETRLAAFESAARRIQKEFPDQKQGHESLLAVARTSADEQYRQLLFELWQTPMPSGIKPGIRNLLDRFYLAGEKIRVVFTDASATELLAALQPGKPTVIYFWAAEDEASLVLASELKERGLAGATLIGINLDQDVAAAQKLVRKENLPGTQYYHTRGKNSPIAMRLKTDAAAVVVLVDASGYIRDTRGEYALATKLAQLGL